MERGSSAGLRRLQRDDEIGEQSRAKREKPMKSQKLDRRRLLAGGAAAMAAPMILSRPAFAITPDEIKKRGKVIIGIQGDNPPWGFVNSSGKQEGFDADISALYAKE